MLQLSAMWVFFKYDFLKFYYNTTNFTSQYQNNSNSGILLNRALTSTELFCNTSRSTLQRKHKASISKLTSEECNIFPKHCNVELT